MTHIEATCPCGASYAYDGTERGAAEHGVAFIAAHKDHKKPEPLVLPVTPGVSPASPPYVGDGPWPYPNTVRCSGSGGDAKQVFDVSNGLVATT